MSPSAFGLPFSHLSYVRHLILLLTICCKLSSVVAGFQWSCFPLIGMRKSGLLEFRTGGQIDDVYMCLLEAPRNLPGQDSKELSEATQLRMEHGVAVDELRLSW